VAGQKTGRQKAKSSPLVSICDISSDRDISSDDESIDDEVTVKKLDCFAAKY
jgi:hypothetical protein